ncbi:hypothetical protein DEIPH_ctg017orf0214 [Deinococcus phoenicis]|uniref:Uncharacterized protein n=1 Tax=Deinococcus phoenicis TaxID=1476583 RepID=A0A016QSF8_9DEIO|nr:hypothetical protein [Deinococcus phoenicis]EYB68837.1 hypothetical protein DEIPH_ctg017orf0214 [Deinococcus phoenicis]
MSRLLVRLAVVPVTVMVARLIHRPRLSAGPGTLCDCTDGARIQPLKGCRSCWGTGTVHR